MAVVGMAALVTLVGDTRAQLLFAEHSLCPPPTSLVSSDDFDEAEVEENDLIRFKDEGVGACTTVEGNPTEVAEEIG